MDGLLVRLLLDNPDLVDGATPTVRAAAAKRLFADPVAQRYLDVNRHRGILWFRKEAMTGLVHRLFFMAAVRLVREHDVDQASVKASVRGRPDSGRPDNRALTRWFDNATALLQAAETAGYQVEALLDII